jgi:sugar lactone lactonase YvrE
VARVLKFDRTGKLIKTIGKFGTGPEDFDQPHALAMDSRGRLFVGDRSNNRIVIMDQEGKVLDTWYQFSRPSGIYIDAQDRIYVADSESGSVGNGRQRTWIPDPAVGPPSTSSAEGVAADKNGVIYGAEVGERALKRYVKK